MGAGSLLYSIMQLSKCRIRSLLCHGLTSLGYNVWSKTFCSLVDSFRSGGECRLLERNDSEDTQRVVNSTDRKSMSSSFESIQWVVNSTAGKLVSSNCESIQVCNPQGKIMGSGSLKRLVKVFVMDIETTGLCKERERIIEIAVRDLSGGENSSFQTLVNPEKYVLNSKYHHITTAMVNSPNVPRMKDLIPILMQFIRSRQNPGQLALFVAHNGRCFDFPFLFNEFSRCNVDVPSDWLFLDTLPLARELKRSNESKVSLGMSKKDLCEHYGILQVGPGHRAMNDANSLALLFQRLTFDLKLTMGDLLERSLTALALVNLKKTFVPKKKEKNMKKTRKKT